MELYGDAMKALQAAVICAQKHHYEYITPELVLLMILEDNDFREAYEECGGDLRALSDNLSSYIDEYVDKVSDKEPVMSAGSNEMIAFAGQSAYSSGCPAIHIRHLIHAIWNLDNSYAVYFMEQQGITEAELLEALSYIEDENKPG